MLCRCRQRCNDKAGQVLDRRLQGLETAIERKQRVPAESRDRRFLFDAQHDQLGFVWAGRQMLDRRPSLPLGHGLLVDAMTPGESPRVLYRATDRRCCEGAPV